MQSAKPKLCQYVIVKPWALFRHLFGAPFPLSKVICCGWGYIVQESDWCLPCNYSGENVLILAVVYFGGAGVVLAAQKGKRCWRSSSTWWKVIQYQTLPALRPHSNHALWNSKWKHARNVFRLSDFDLWFGDFHKCMPTLWKTQSTLSAPSLSNTAKACFHTSYCTSEA